MAGFIVKQSAGSAPPVAKGMGLFRFDGVRDTFHEDWKGKPNKFNDRLDTGERWAFDFTVLDEDTTEVVYDPREENEGDELSFYHEVNRSVGENSNAYKLLKGILTDAELAKLDAGEEFDLEGTFGRIVQGVVTLSEKGWPKMDSTMPASKGQLAKYAARGAA